MSLWEDIHQNLQTWEKKFGYNWNNPIQLISKFHLELASIQFQKDLNCIWEFTDSDYLDTSCYSMFNMLFQAGIESNNWK